jgi:hypothetical protein
VAHAERMRDLAQLSLRTISAASLNHRPSSPAAQQQQQQQQQHGAPRQQQQQQQQHSASMQDKLHAVQMRLDECRANHASLAAGPLLEYVRDPGARRF